MADDLPNILEAETPLNSEELNVLRRQYSREGSGVTTQTKFNLAWGLIRSRAKADQQYGVQLLGEIFQDTPDRRRECLYYLSLGHYKLGEYTNARNYNNQLLEREPNNLQAKSLERLIEEGINRDGLWGLAIAGGVAALGTAIAVAMFKKK